jgi:sugar/nucleoside kinase (ribokinase family)
MVAVIQFGATSFYSCKVASDTTGDFFMRDLDSIGVDTNFAAGRQTGFSGQCISMITPDAERTMTTHLGISETLSTDELNEDALRNSKYLYIEGYLVTSPSAFKAVLKAQEIAKNASVKVSLTLSDPAIVEHFKSAFDQLAEQGIDLIFCNEEEAMIWTGSKTADEAFSKLQTICKQVAMTRGKDGASVFDGKSVATVPGTPTQAVDTTGAGDIFAGAFLASITTGQSFESAAGIANKAASRLVSDFGARLDNEVVKSLV